MNKLGVGFGIIIIILAFIILPFTLDAFDSWNYKEEQNISSVTTATGITTGNITLGYELYSSNLDSVLSISSSDTDDTPAPSSYNENNKILTVSGLQAETTRTLTTGYRTPRADSYLPTLAGIFPLFITLCLLAVGGGIAWRSWK